MLAVVHRLAIGRLAAVLLALALSGAVRVAAAQESHEATHRCACPTTRGAHDCACPRCRSAAAAEVPSPEALAALPPCHRARYAARAAAAGQAPSPKPDQDCASPRCSMPDGRLHAAPTTDTFLLPEPPQLSMADWSGPLPAARPACASAVPSPEPPPPRA